MRFVFINYASIAWLVHPIGSVCFRIAILNFWSLIAIAFAHYRKIMNYMGSHPILMTLKPTGYMEVAVVFSTNTA